MPSSRPFEEVLRDYLLDDSEIQSYVDSRIGPYPLPQGTRRASVTYVQQGRDNYPTQTDPGVLAAHQWQLDCWARKYGIARQLAEAIRKRLNGFDGPLGGFSRITFFLEDWSEGFEDDSKLHRVMLDFTVWYREEI